MILISDRIRIISTHSYIGIDTREAMQCFFCSQNSKVIDYKEVDLLRRFISSQGKIIDPQHTGVCAKHQRMLSRAIKRARIMGLLPFIRR